MRLLLTWIFCVLALTAAGQQHVIDSLNRLYKAKIKQPNPDTSLLNVLLLLNEQYIDRDLDKAFTFTKEAMEVAQKMKWTNYSATMLNRIGNMYRNRGLYDIALESFTKSFSMHEELGETGALAFCSNDIGNIYYDQGAYRVAMQYYGSGLKYSRTSGVWLAEVVSLNNLALCHWELKNSDSAIYLVNAALNISKKHNHGGQIVLDYRYLGDYNRSLKKFDLAQQYYDSAFALYTQRGDTGKMGQHYQLTGSLDRDRGNYTKAMAEYRLAEELYRQSGLNTQLADLYFAKASLFKVMNRPDSAIQAYQVALKFSERQKLLTKMQAAYFYLSELYEQKGRAAEALAYFKKGAILKDSIFNEGKTQKIASLRAAYLLHQKQQELDNAQDAVELQKADLRTRKATNTILWLAIGVTLCIAMGTALALANNRRQTRKLKLQNQVIENQTQEIEAHLESLEKAKKQAEDHLRVKSEFLSNMSHEIRTPMNAIIGFTDLMLEKQHTGETRQNLEAVRYAAGNLAVIINDILDLSKIESGQMNLERIPFQPRDLLAKLEQMIRISWPSPQVEFSYTLAPEVPWQITGDPTRLNQLLLNLCNNAMKFTTEGSVSVQVTAPECEGGQCLLRFEVKDTGIGIPENMHEGIFQSFMQASAETSRRYGGTGLGLAICKKLVEMQGGRMGVISAPGKGSTFWFEITYPVHTQHQPADTKAALQQTTTEGTPSLKGIHILCVEDNNLNQRLIKKLLAKWGATSEMADDAFQAMEKLRTNRFDLLLMDIQMPGMDGMELTRRIRNGETGQLASAYPILGLTADVFEETRQAALQAGMNNLVLKPIQQQTLLEAIQQVLGKVGTEA